MDIDHESSHPGQDPPATTNHPVPAIDVQRVAERVYRLLLADLRLDVARAQGGNSRGG
jgi:hypothetical protein